MGKQVLICDQDLQDLRDLVEHHEKTIKFKNTEIAALREALSKSISYLTDDDTGVPCWESNRCQAYYVDVVKPTLEADYGYIKGFA